MRQRSLYAHGISGAILIFLLFWRVPIFGGPAAAESMAASQVPSAAERDRDSWQQPEKVMDAIGVKAGMTIGEVGAGNGYFTFKLAARVGPTGLIYANDIDPDGLQNIKAGARQRRIDHIVTVRGEVADPLFPPGVMDLVIMVYVFHELAEPVELLRNLKPSLKPDAPLVILERDPGKIHSTLDHFYDQDKLLQLVREAGYELVRVETFLARDNIYILRPIWASSPPPEPSISNQEGKFLPGVVRYDLRFHLQLKENRLEAVADMTVENPTTQDITEIPFILYRLFDVQEVMDDKQVSFPFNQTIVKFSDEKSLQVNLVSVRPGRPLAPGKRIAVRIKYAGTLWGYPEVMAYVRDRIDEDYSLLRPDSLAFPLLARPSFRSMIAAFESPFTYRVETEVPVGYVVACGGREIETRSEKKSIIFAFESHKPTWRIDVAVARFKIIGDEGGKIRIYAIPGDEGEGQRILAATQKSFRFYSGLFGNAGRFPGFTIIEIPEGWGSQAGDFYVLQTAAAFRDKARISELYHEIAHNWNAKAKPEIQRCRYFDEAFASYFQGLAIKEFEGEEAFAKYMTRLRDRFLQSCEKDEKNGSTPIADYWKEERGENSYTKGAWSLFVLHQAVGETVFPVLMAGFLREFRTREADFADFQSFAEKTSGLNLGPFFKEWIFGAESTRLLREKMAAAEIAARYR
jgi:predicted methyltransferase